MQTEEMKPMREKYWAELSDSEKIERMRYVVKSIKKRTERLSTDTHKLKCHLHLDGNLVVPFEDGNSGEEPATRRGDEWF